jgi:signal transduction histidine kinase
MANVIVQEVLRLRAPTWLQVEDISVADVIRDAIAMAEEPLAQGDVDGRRRHSEALRPIQGDPHQLRQIFTNLIQRVRGDGRNGAVEISATAIDTDERRRRRDQGRSDRC